MTDLIVNRFYWVRVAALDGSVKLRPWEPARYTGKSADTHAREETRGKIIVVVAYSPDTWDFIGQRSDDGHHFLEVREVGEEIRCGEWPERAKPRKVRPAPAKAAKKRKAKK